MQAYNIGTLTIVSCSDYTTGGVYQADIGMYINWSVFVPIYEMRGGSGHT